MPFAYGAEMHVFDEAAYDGVSCGLYLELFDSALESETEDFSAARLIEPMQANFNWLDDLPTILYHA